MNKERLENRVHSIDLLKLFAAILITNSHMAGLYPESYKALSTGGAIGDALFFFCSGYLLYGGKKDDLFNWYKRRVNRIFPTIFAVALISIVFLGGNPSLKDVIINGGGWFVQAIFVFYFLFWFIRRFLEGRLWVAIILFSTIVFIWYIWFWDKDVFILYSNTYLRWPIYFIVMLMGGFVREKEIQLQPDQHRKEINVWLWLVLLVFFLFLYYGYQLLESKIHLLRYFEIVLSLVLMGKVYSFYKVCSSEEIIKIYRIKYLYWLLYGISACCLEIYLSGGMVFGIGERMINLFPLNIIITFIFVFIVSYLVKVFSNILSQTFRAEKYDWKELFII